MMPHGNAQADDGRWLIHEDGPVPHLLPNEIHLWRAALDVSGDKLHVLESTLSPDERKRADRFRFPEHRARFIAARGILRSILAAHLGCPAGELEFSYSEHGKPSLAGPEGMRVEFNLSHSADLAVYAVALERRVGVDVEFMKPDGSWLRIAEQYFSAEEFSRLSKLPEEEMRVEFFDLWAVKEARLKGIGVGLRFPLESIVDDAAWTVLNFTPEAGYAAALAYVSSSAPVSIVKHHFSI